MKFTIPPVPAQLIPLSEDERLTLISPREFYVLEGEHPGWDEVTSIGPGERRSISVKIHVEARARARMIRIFDVPEGSRLTLYHYVTIAEGGSWDNVIGIRGRGEVTIRRAIDVLGKGAEVRLGCLASMEKSSRISVSDEIFSQAAGTKNDLRTKIVLKKQARSEVRGRVVVDEKSRQSTSYERLDHLVFGDQTSAVSIPELEVKTDDVQCGHGATTSRPDETEIFYLTSRGLSVQAAEQLLARGFLAGAFVDLSQEVVDQALNVVLG
jgi:Fe-S cluster assembly protein SufD